MNRLDDSIVFRTLTKDDLKEIVDIPLNEFNDRVKELGYSLELSQELIQGMDNEQLAHRIIRREKIKGNPANFLYSLLKDLSVRPKLISLVPSSLERNDQLHLGKIIHQVIQESSRRIAFIVLDYSSNYLTKGNLLDCRSHHQFLNEKILFLLGQKDSFQLDEEAKEEKNQFLLTFLGLLEELGIQKWKSETMIFKNFQNKDNLIINFKRKSKDSNSKNML